MDNINYKIFIMITKNMNNKFFYSTNDNFNGDLFNDMIQIIKEIRKETDPIYSIKDNMINKKTLFNPNSLDKRMMFSSKGNFII